MAARCVICDRAIPAGTSGPGRTCGSPECRTAFAGWASSRRRDVRRARHEVLTGERTCDECGLTLPLDAEHFKPVGRGYFRRRCVDCQRAVERARAHGYYDRMKANPDRYTAYLANSRLRHRLRREQETGHAPIRQFRGARGAYRNNAGSMRGGLPIEPLQEWLEAVIAREAPELGRSSLAADRDGVTAEALATTLDTDQRGIWRIRHGEHRTVALGTADRLLTGYGRPVVIRTRDLERRLVEWAQEQPGNGTRLLAYIDRAETVAHLADVALLRLEDLWPRELGE